MGFWLGERYEYRSFEGEGRGFRRRSALTACLEAELHFCADVFGFTAP
jgi:hypothetical protein